MILLNFSHPLSAEQLLIAESLVSSKFTSIIDIKTHLETCWRYHFNIATMAELQNLAGASQSFHHQLYLAFRIAWQDGIFPCGATGEAGARFNTASV